MKKVFLSVLVVLFLLHIAGSTGFSQTAPYTPEKGSVERKAILDGVRKYRKAPNEVYTPTMFRVQNGWALVSAYDPNEPGIDTAAFDLVLRKTGKNWTVVDEISHAEGANYQTEVKRIRKKFPRLPANLFS